MNNFGQLFISSDPQKAIPYFGELDELGWGTESLLCARLFIICARQFIPEEAIALHDDYASAHFNLGLARLNLGQTLGAIESFTKSLSLNPSDGRVRHLLGGAILSHAKDLLAKGDVSEARNRLTQAKNHVDFFIEQFDATDSRANLIRCEIGRLLGHDAKLTSRYCEAALDAPSKTKTDVAIAYNLLGIFAKQAGHYSDAADYFQSGLEADGHSLDLHLNLASTLTDMHEYERAHKYFQQAETIPLSDPLLKSYLLANKGWLFEVRGLRSQARDLYAEAVDLSQPNTHPQIVANLRNIEQYCLRNDCN